MLVNIIMVVFVALALFLLPTFFHLEPYLADAVFRARGSEALEFSVSVTRERNTIAYLLLIPFIMIMSRYNMYSPSFMDPMGKVGHLVTCAGVLGGYILLRFVLHMLLRPRRNYDYFRLAQKAIYTFFILFMLLALPALGIMTVMDVNDVVIRTVLYILLAVSYVIFLIRKAQILSLSCGGFTTFLYLCALEILPTSLLVISALVL